MFPLIPLNLSTSIFGDRMLLMQFPRGTEYDTYLGNLNRICLQNGLVDAFSLTAAAYDAHRIYRSRGLVGFHLVSQYDQVASITCEPKGVGRELGKTRWLRQLKLNCGNMVIEVNDPKAKGLIQGVASSLSDFVGSPIEVVSGPSLGGRIIYPDFSRNE